MLLSHISVSFSPFFSLKSMGKKLRDFILKTSVQIGLLTCLENGNPTFIPTVQRAQEQSSSCLSRAGPLRFAAGLPQPPLPVLILSDIPRHGGVRSLGGPCVPYPTNALLPSAHVGPGTVLRAFQNFSLYRRGRPTRPILLQSSLHV